MLESFFEPGTGIEFLGLGEKEKVLQVRKPGDEG